MLIIFLFAERTLTRFSTVVLLSAVLCVIPTYGVNNYFPQKPFSTDGRWMTNADGQRLIYAGVNWPAHGETMVPEGLRYSSIADLVSKMNDIGMNA